MTVSDVAGQFKTAIVTAATTAISDATVKVCYGHPGTDQPDDIVSVGKVTAVIDPATLSASLRTRELTLTVEVTASVHRGGAEQEQAAGTRAYQLLNLIEEYVRVTDTTLGGLVRWCFCVGHDSDGVTDPQIAASGSLIEATATFLAKARITN